MTRYRTYMYALGNISDNKISVENLLLVEYWNQRQQDFFLMKCTSMHIERSTAG